MRIFYTGSAEQARALSCKKALDYVQEKLHDALGEGRGSVHLHHAFGNTQVEHVVSWLHDNGYTADSITSSNIFISW